MAEQQKIFTDWLGGLLAETRQLLSFLQQEKAALESRRLEELIALSQGKNAAATRINQMLAQFPDHQGPKSQLVEQLLASLGLQTDSSAAQSWAEIRQLTGQCRALNEANGAAIALLQEYNRQALTVLFGRRRQQVGYGADGQTMSNGDDRLLGAS